MRGFAILRAEVPEERARWIELWGLWPDREVFAHPAYVSLFCDKGDRALCAAWSGEHGGVIFPLIARPIAKEPWAKVDTAHCDLTSPYGYGGPFSWGNVQAQEYWERFNAWAREAGMVSCFARLSLFSDQHLPFDGVVERNALNVVRSLDIEPSALWMDYEHKVRKNVKRARSRGVVVERDQAGAHLAEFLNIYYATMGRREASKIYYFPETFFRNIVEGLPGQFAFFHALLEGRVVSTELVLVSERNIYSFLGGTLEDAFDVRPNDILKHEIILWGIEARKSGFVLGGGYGGTDGIFNYKRSLAPGGVRPYSVGNRVWDDRAYVHLIEMRRQYEARNGNEWGPRPGFFPAYRS
ncbi:MAG: GNAT family N-acetyltransferase [Deltaproteobacteria bacterium]|nr:GNAT family N-acetyltransferase [Deltaproteobacteria bacterium]